ncbi:ankyrin repeat domain-containing protein [Hydrogenimonas sp.]
MKYLGLALLFVIASGVSYWLDFKLPPSFDYSSKFYLDKKEQTYEVSLKDGFYRLGFYIGQRDIRGKKNDGEYLLQYYCNGKLAKKNKSFDEKIKKHIIHDSFNLHTLIVIDEFKIPNDLACNDFKVKIETIKNFSIFNELNISNRVILYIRDSHEVEEFSNHMENEMNIFRKKYPRDFEFVPVDYLNDKNLTKLSLMKALFKRDLKSFKHILTEHNLSVDIELGQDSEGVDTKRTPLVYASYFNDLPTVKYLLENGADINRQDFIKTTPLQYATKNNSVDVVKYLLKHGADKELACFIGESVTGYEKSTPLTYAIKHEYYELTKVLLENGFRKIDLDCKGIDNSGMDSPLNYIFTPSNQKKPIEYSKDDPFAPETKVHIYDYLYQMDYPVRFLKLFKKYGLKDEKYEKDFTEEWFKKDFEECQTGHYIYSGRCNYILEHNITLEQYDIYKFFEIIGYENRNKKNNKRSK